MLGREALIAMKRSVRAVIVVLFLAASAQAQAQTQAPPLRVEGRHFLDPHGRVVILRGINLAGDSKVPPFRPIDDPSALDPLPDLGFNVVRLVVSWEAVEPRPGLYDHAYLGRMKAIATECAARGLYVVVDIHQDGFSRYLARGSGDGFPPWAISPAARLSQPDNGPTCANWPIRMALDRGMHRSFRDFYSDANGVRTRYLAMVRLLAREFASVPLVIGYDLLNEPWGRERSELPALYADAERAVRAEHPSAILFIEGHVTTNCGLQTRLPRPEFGNYAYSPHYYKPAAILSGAWRGSTGTIDWAFANIDAKAAEWDVPVFLSEFGAPAENRRAGDYVAYLYDRLDAEFSSGAQWNYTPHWNSEAKDGWNGEDFNILLGPGRIRGNFRPRPFPRAIAGSPHRFRYDESAPGRRAVVELVWDAQPGRGDTEIYLPRAVFPAGSEITLDPPELAVRFDPARQVIAVAAPRPGRVRLRVVSAIAPWEAAR